MKSLFKDKSVCNLFWLSVLTMIESLQVLIIVVLVFSFIPIKMADITHGVGAQVLQFFKPEREITFYRFFIVLSMVGMGLAVWFLRTSLSFNSLTKQLKSLIIVDGALVVVQLFFTFKILQYDDPSWARFMLYVTLGLSLLSRIFWPEVKDKLIHWRVKAIVADAIVLFIVILGLMINDMTDALARIRVWDSFNHWDQWLMVKGIPGSYAQVLTGAIVLTIMYYLLVYVFARRWLNNVMLAGAAVLLMVKLQMFNTGVSPLVWLTPERTPLRFLLDVLVFFCLWQHGVTGQKHWLWISSCVCGLALAYVLDTGIYLTAAFTVYIITLMINPDLRNLVMEHIRLWRVPFVIAVLPWGIMFMVVVCGHGLKALTADYWIALVHPYALMLNGVGALPFWDCLKDRNFFAFFAGFAIVIFLVGALLFNAAYGIYAGCRQAVFRVFLSVYGLGLFLPFAWHSSINYYYLCAVPLVLLMADIVNQGLKRIHDLKRKQGLEHLIWLLCAIALFSNMLFTYYPNVFRLASTNWSAERADYSANYNFKEDAALIDQYAPFGNKALVISSFATGMMRVANRLGFFDEPVLNSVPLNGNNFGGLVTQDKAGVLKLLDQWKNNLPPYVFVERKLTMSSMAAAFKNASLGWSAVMEFLESHYEPVLPLSKTEGRWLMVYKIK